MAQTVDGRVADMLSPALRKKYFPDGRFADPRTRLERFIQCMHSVDASNRRTIVQYDQERVCLRNIYNVSIPITERELLSKIASLEASEKYRLPAQAGKARTTKTVRKQAKRPKKRKWTAGTPYAICQDRKKRALADRDEVWSAAKFRRCVRGVTEAHQAAPAGRRKS